MIPLYNINNLEIENIPSISPIKTKISNLILSTLLTLTVLGLGLYVINKTISNSEYEDL